MAQWQWAHTVEDERLLGQHTVQFVVDPGDVLSETYESNNNLQDRTDAMSLFLAVTPELYQALETPVDEQWPFSAEDWLQKQIAAMNAAFARSVYSTVPDGIQERVRLDKILITSSPPPADWAEDGGFFFGSCGQIDLHFSCTSRILCRLFYYQNTTTRSFQDMIT